MVFTATTNDTLLGLDEERALVERAQAGDLRVMDRLLGAHYRQLYHLALKITRDPVKAEDVTQEACLLILRRIGQFRSEARFGTWACRIVVNTALLRHRREKRLVPTAEIVCPQPNNHNPGPDQLAVDRQLLTLANDFLEQGREGDHHLFVRRFVDGLSLQSLSHETGLSLPALKSRFHRARIRLKEESARAGWGVLRPETRAPVPC